MGGKYIKLYIILGSIVICAVVAAIVYSVFLRQGSYPRSVRNIIDNPVEVVGDWKVLIDHHNYEIAYSKVGDADFFFISIKSKQVASTVAEAEQDFLNRLDIDKNYACSMPVIVQVERGVDDRLWGYEFGLSFCPEKPHISDKMKALETFSAAEFYIKTVEEGSMKVKNFYRTAAKVETDRVVIKSTPSYQIYYYPHRDGFEIIAPVSTENSLISPARQAVLDIQKALGINSAQVCQLPIAVASSINEELESVSLSSLLGC